MERRTKILGTLGPASWNKARIEELVVAGMDAIRLNFSHGKHDQLARTIADIRAIEGKLGRPIGILADIQGPKIRVGRLAGGEVLIPAESTVYMTSEPIVGGLQDGKMILPCGYRDFVKDVQPGYRILLDDGLLELAVVEKEGTLLRCHVIVGGVVKENKGINVPEASFSALAITEKDYTDILFCVEHKVDFIALSFVRAAQEVRHLKEFLSSRGTTIQVVSKIEKPDALVNLDEIIDVSDGVLVARGDLAVEIGNERVPVWQKRIVRRCNLKGKFVIIATQMLMSMVDNPRPTRAEASDVANAIVDGTDVLMLSNETAVGKYPVEAVRMMARITEEMENDLPSTQSILYNEWELPERGQLAVALLQSAVRMAAILHARSLTVVTRSGSSAFLLSKCRPRTNVAALTSSVETYRQLSLAWGVKPFLLPEIETWIEQTSVFDSIGAHLVKLKQGQHGDKIVITAGLPRLSRGSTNTIKVHQL